MWTIVRESRVCVAGAAPKVGSPGTLRPTRAMCKDLGGILGQSRSADKRIPMFSSSPHLLHSMSPSPRGAQLQFHQIHRFLTTTHRDFCAIQRTIRLWCRGWLGKGPPSSFTFHGHERRGQRAVVHKIDHIELTTLLFLLFHSKL